MGKSWNYPSRSRKITKSQQNWRARIQGGIRTHTQSMISKENFDDIETTKNPRSNDYWFSPYDGSNKRQHPIHTETMIKMIDGRCSDQRLFDRTSRKNQIVVYLSSRSDTRVNYIQQDN